MLHLTLLIIQYSPSEVDPVRTLEQGEFAGIMFIMSFYFTNKEDLYF